MEFSQFSLILQERCQINLGQKFLLGVSGGADSMCLLHLLWQAGHPVVVAHLDHMIRPNSGQDAGFVKNVCDTWNIPVVIKQIDVGEYCHTHNLNLEEGARNLRYEFLYEVAKETGSSCIFIAHQADDQVETVLMHFIRGAGLSGLKGMLYRTFLAQYSNTIPLIRPLLGFTRLQIEGYCNENHIPFITDQTNLDTTYFRNKLRHELIPELETYNPRFREVIQRSTESLQADHDLINEIVTTEWNTILLETGSKYIRLNADKLRLTSSGMRKNIYRRAATILRPDLRDFDHIVLDRLDDFVIHPPEQKAIDLVGHLEARLDNGALWIVESGYKAPIEIYPQFSEPERFIEFPLHTMLTNEWLLTGEILDSCGIEASSIMHAPKNEAWLDYGTISGAISLRNIHPGDRIQPLGGSGHHAKVSDLFINHGIPREARPAYPVFCDSKRIIWLPGVMISEMCKLTENSKKILHLIVKPV